MINKYVHAKNNRKKYEKRDGIMKGVNELENSVMSTNILFIKFFQGYIEN